MYLNWLEIDYEQSVTDLCVSCAVKQKHHHLWNVFSVFPLMSGGFYALKKKKIA